MEMLIFIKTLTLRHNFFITSIYFQSSNEYVIGYEQQRNCLTKNRALIFRIDSESFRSIKQPHGFSNSAAVYDALEKGATLYTHDAFYWMPLKWSGEATREK
jgi:hypothetical protein